MKKKKRLAFQQLIDACRREGARPRCPHFGECGGCILQTLAYDEQLLLKKEYGNSMLGDVATIDAVHPADPWRYRNRMDFVVAFGKAGLRQAGSFKRVVDIESCEIMQERSNELLKTARPLLLEAEGYNYLNHEGYLRYIVLRQAFFTGQTMVNFVVAGRENRLEKLIESVLPGADSVSLLFNDGLADTSFGTVMEHYKNDAIEERIDGMRFRITPNSFFQSNSAITEVMYRKIRNEVRGRVLDLYAGVGSISLSIAGAADEVTGIELVPEAVRSAEENRALNGLTNVTFACADARDFMEGCDTRYDTVVCDPPRSGMHPKVCAALERLAPERIVYMSCNPATFAADCRLLAGYRVAGCEAFDMFPQTPHIELLAVLERKRS